jgi:hypothetical protein
MAVKSWSARYLLQCPECWCEERRVALRIPVFATLKYGEIEL